MIEQLRHTGKNVSFLIYSIRVQLVTGASASQPLKRLGARHF